MKGALLAPAINLPGAISHLVSWTALERAVRSESHMKPRPIGTNGRGFSLAVSHGVPEGSPDHGGVGSQCTGHGGPVVKRGVMAAIQCAADEMDCAEFVSP